MPASELLKFVKTDCRQKAKGQSVEVKSAHVDGPRQLYDTLSSFSSQDKGLSTEYAVKLSTKNLTWKTDTVPLFVCFCI